MVQEALPTADGAYTNCGGSPNNTVGQRFTNIDESSLDSGDFVQTTFSASSGSTGTGSFETFLGPVTDPEVNTGHTITIPVGKSAANGQYVFIDAALHANGTEIVGPGLMAANFNSAATAFTISYALTSGQVDALRAAGTLPYEHLSLRFRLTESNNPNALDRAARQGRVYQAKVTVPDRIGEVITITSAPGIAESAATAAGTLLLAGPPVALSGESAATGTGTITISAPAAPATAETAAGAAGTLLLAGAAAQAAGESSAVGVGRLRFAGAGTATATSAAAAAGQLQLAAPAVVLEATSDVDAVAGLLIPAPPGAGHAESAVTAAGTLRLAAGATAAEATSNAAGTGHLLLAAPLVEAIAEADVVVLTGGEVVAPSVVGVASSDATGHGTIRVSAPAAAGEGTTATAGAGSVRLAGGAIATATNGAQATGALLIAAAAVEAFAHSDVLFPFLVPRVGHLHADVRAAEIEVATTTAHLTVATTTATIDTEVC